MHSCTRVVACAVLAAALFAASVAAAAQTDTTLSGRLLNSLSGDPIAGATVVLEELRREATSGSDGAFTFDNVPPGTYHLSVRSDEYSSRRTEVSVSATPSTPVDVKVDPELRYHEVVSVSPDARSQFEAYQPTSVLVGQELSKQLEMSLGGALENEPGVAARSFGPATARPVIRGLSGDRVQILQDGARMGDLSSQSGDHAVTVNPASAQRIEVVRGPATLLYGANAIGGLVNVITDQIPTTPQQGASGNVMLDVGSAAKEAGAAADLRVGNGTVALNVGGGGRHSGDVDTPEGEIVNSQSRSGFANIGLGWTGTKGYFGGSYGYDDTKLGIPIVEGGILQSTPRKHSVVLRAGARDLTGVFDSFRATLTARRYKHEELEGEEVGTAFKNDTNELELLGSHRAVGRLKGSIGAWILGRAFDAVGAEALSPAIDQRAFAGFVYEELTWPHVTIQGAGRVDNTRYTPVGEDQRTFTTGSGSAGLLLRPAAANDAVTIALSLARAARYPAIEELFYFGPHPGNFAFEIGNPNLEPEHALGFDMALRWRSARASGEVSYFRNNIDNYVFRRPVSPEEFEERTAEFAERFPTRGIGADEAAGGGEEEEFPVVENVSLDSLLQGIEAHGDFQITAGVAAEVGLDYVRGSVRATDEPLPFIPPLRFRGGLRYQHNAFQAGGDVAVTAKQDRVFSTETPTDGYQLLRLFAAYSFTTGNAVSTITARLDNATNELYRNHLSFIKELAPEMGRNFKLLYNVKF
jgi:iron complex outermembrane receptor protein